jgi:anaerobic ribonucleoside-triphosphate reductase
MSAVLRALLATGEGSEADAERVTTSVVKALEKHAKTRKGEYIPSVEEVQDTVETELIYNHFARTAKAYIIYREEHKKLREVTGIVPESIKELAREGDTSYTLDPLLERTRETASQVSLPRHLREENMRSAFRATRCAAELPRTRARTAPGSRSAW